MDLHLSKKMGTLLWSFQKIDLLLNTRAVCSYNLTKMPTKQFISKNDECEFCFTCLNQPGGKSRNFTGCALGCYSAHRRIHGDDFEKKNANNRLEVIRKANGSDWRDLLRLVETKPHPLKKVPIQYFELATKAFHSSSEAASPSTSTSDSDSESTSNSDSDTERTTAPAPQQSNEEGLREAMLRAMTTAQKVEMFRLMSDEEQKKMEQAMPAEQAREMFALMP